jgi:hypothetical protein
VHGRGPFLFSNHHFFGTYRAELLASEFPDLIQYVCVRDALRLGKFNHQLSLASRAWLGFPAMMVNVTPMLFALRA